MFDDDDFESTNHDPEILPERIVNSINSLVSSMDRQMRDLSDSQYQMRALRDEIIFELTGETYFDPHERQTVDELKQVYQVLGSMSPNEPYYAVTVDAMEVLERGLNLGAEKLQEDFDYLYKYTGNFVVGNNSVTESNTNDKSLEIGGE